MDSRATLHTVGHALLVTFELTITRTLLLRFYVVIYVELRFAILPRFICLRYALRVAFDFAVTRLPTVAFGCVRYVLHLVAALRLLLHELVE